MYAFENIESEIAKLNSEMQSLQYEVSGVRVFSRLNPNVLPPVDHPINEMKWSPFSFCLKIERAKRRLDPHYLTSTTSSMTLDQDSGTIEIDNLTL